MYPYDLFLGLDMYDILLVVGFFSALMFFRYWADIRRFPVKLQNLCIVSALVAIVLGYGSAVLFQAYYNYLEDGTFEIVSGTGATFYGGLIGGALVFLLLYFGVGHFGFRDSVTKTYFFELSEIAAGSIAFAHAFGRIGCLFAGCCHGKITDAWYGAYNAALGVKTVPIQLFEAIFLFALAWVMAWRLHRKRPGNLGLYLVAYAVWRFLIEFLRDDNRGDSPIAFLSPSQFIACLLLFVGVGVWGLQYYLKKRKKGDAHDAP